MKRDAQAAHPAAPEEGLATSRVRRLHLEVTNRCNSRCETCLRTIQPEADRDMSVQEVEAIVGGLHGLRSVALQVNGEPLLHPQLDDIVAMLASRGIRVELNTNGIPLSASLAGRLIDARLDQLNVSIDGASAETYHRIRGVDALAKVLDNVRAFIQLRGSAADTPSLWVWTMAMQQNIEELPALVDLAAGLGADGLYLQRLVFFGQGLATRGDSLHGRLSDGQRAIIGEAVRRAADVGLPLAASGGYLPEEMLGAQPDREPARSCRRPWESAVVMADGDVVPCCISTFIAARPTITLGNVLRDGWESIWSAEPYARFRAALQEGPLPDPCTRCGLDWSL